MTGDPRSCSSAHGPWRPEELLPALLGSALGVVFLLFSWWGASGAAEVSRQLRWMTLGAIGLVVAGVSAAWLLASAQRTIGAARTALLLHPRLPRDPQVHLGAGPGPPGFALVAATPMTRFHRPACVFVQGKQVETMSAAAHRRAGRRACEACLP